ncbi:MAG TPA: ABC transporter ATP-binding protein [Candidatus Bathyarchaeota archaeon]|nr:ABC transporter ATP-binding protein [Candidatus Bathyarchaeota archaeon]
MPRMWHYLREVGEEGKPQASGSEIVKRFLGYLMQYRGLFLLFISISVISLLLSIFLPAIMKNIIDEGIVKRNFEALKGGILLLSIFTVGVWIFTVLRDYLLSFLTERLLRDLRLRMLRHAEKLDYGFYTRYPAGQIIARFTSDINTIGNVFTSGLVDTVLSLFTIVGALYLMITLNMTLTLAVAATLPFLTVASIYFARRSRSAYRVARHKVGELTSNVEQTVTGIRVSQSFTERRSVNFRDFQKIGYETMEANIKATLMMALIRPIISLIRASSIAILIMYGGYLVTVGESTIGTLVAFYSYMEMFYNPIVTISMFYTTLQSALAAAERIFNFLDEKTRVVEAEDAEDVRIQEGKIIFENVWFRYEDEWVFKDLNLTIEGGSRIALVGPTGAGKTTLTNLILRLYDPQKGSVKIDGKDLRKVTLSSLKRQVSLVPQEPILFRMNVYQNIVLDQQVSEEDVEKIIEDMGLSPIFRTFPNGLKTEVLERGKNLSVGQRQLINIVRAIVRSPKIIILDEATSSIDPETENILKNALRKMMQNRTCVIISHRFSLVDIAEDIIVLDKGRIVDRGTHQKLLERCQLYQRIFRSQIEGK